ncbi:MAG: DUF262 and DUF1524 domain-containing protein [Clostridiaceae bacterium]|nr:DUF262 and DUF1524 domain-containing protein [Clostridiaceae bacterium]
MDAKKGNIFEILNGYRQFIIPVYQRTYSWELAQCEKLWKDIVSMQKENRTGHFVGSIVNVAEQVMPTGVQKFMIIDGQQRMTTLTLLLIALRDYALKNPQDQTVNAPMITDMCLKNTYQQGDDRFKMLLTQSDRQTLIALVDFLPNENDASRRLIANYNYFADKIMSKEIPPQEIYEAIGKLQIVNITLDRAVDDPQLIFESLNSTGMDLSQSDLIRNYILMGLQPQEQIIIYESIWHPMEKLFGYEKQSDLMDKFFRDYLTYKNGRIPNLNKIYDEFKSYHVNCGFSSIAEFCKDIFNCAVCYTNISFSKSGHPELNKAFAEIKTLQMDVVYPFLLKVHVDFNKQLISLEEFTEISNLCISYIVRRAICGTPTNSLNKTFATLKNAIRTECYIESFKAAMIAMDSYKAYPTDDEFMAALALKDIYNMRIRNYILGKIESYQNKSPIIVSNYTIEHIMPQNPRLSVEWQSALGKDWKEIQKRYLHTIGNLTLTAYNTEMSDKSFLEKLEMSGGFKQSGLRINSFLITQTTWNEQLIMERAHLLSDICRHVWGYPQLDDSVLEKYKPETKAVKVYSLNDYEYLNSFTEMLFEQLNKHILSISSDVKREFKKLYVAYKADTNFVDVVIQKSRLRLAINMRFDDVHDPKGLCKNITDVGRWGNGDVELFFESLSQLDDVMDIIEQSYNKQTT